LSGGNTCPEWLPPPLSRGRIARGDDQAIDPVLHDLWDSSHRSHDHRKPRGHRRKKRDGESLPKGREGENIHRPEQLGQVATRSKEEDGIPDPLPHGLIAEPILLPPAADDQKGHLPPVPGQPAGGVDQVFLPLLLFEAPHRPDEEPVSGQTELPPGLFPRQHAVELLHIHAIGDYADFPRRDPVVSCDVVADRLRSRKDERRPAGEPPVEDTAKDLGPDVRVVNGDDGGDPFPERRKTAVQVRMVHMSVNEIDPLPPDQRTKKGDDLPVEPALPEFSKFLHPDAGGLDLRPDRPFPSDAADDRKETGPVEIARQGKKVIFRPPHSQVDDEVEDADRPLSRSPISLTHRPRPRDGPVPPP